MGHLAYFFRRKPTVLVMQVGAVIMLISSIIGWVSVTTGDDAFSLDGADLTPLVRLVGVMGVVVGLLITISRHWIRAVLASVLLGGAIIALIAAATVIAEPAGSAESALALRGIAVDQAEIGFGAGSLMGALGALILFVGALAVLLFSPGWDDENPQQEGS